MSTGIIDTLESRGFIKQCTDLDALREHCAKGPVSAYIGYDPTASSLHVGNLLTIITMMHLERAGHRPVALIGGGTARVGDPSGKTEMRQLLGQEQIDENKLGFRKQLGRFLSFEADKSTMVDNAEWLTDLNYIDFLRTIGRHFSVNRMLSAEAYRSRMERGLSFIEFNYQILQAYDFLELRRRHGVTLQMGGDDQWGNILAGVDLCRRVDESLVHGLTFPLLTTATGAKMGKTASGAVWLDAERMSPYEFFQYWINVHDDDVKKLFAFYTFLPMEEVNEVSRLNGAELNQAKSMLAWEVTSLVHGKAEADKSLQAAQQAFGARAISSSLLPSSQMPREASSAQAQLPTLKVDEAWLEEGAVSVITLLREAKFSKSNSEARRLISQGGVKWDGQAVDDIAATIAIGSISADGHELRAGKKRVIRVLPS